MALTDKDEELLALLRLNAREPVAALARKLGLSRTTVQDRLRRLEQQGVITGYRVKLGEAGPRGALRGMINISVEPRRQIEVAKMISRLPEVEVLHTVSGKFDMMAEVKANSPEAIDLVIDRIGQLPGVTEIETAVILSTKLDRR